MLSVVEAFSETLSYLFIIEPFDFAQGDSKS
jgi:hypothetical protein